MWQATGEAKAEEMSLKKHGMHHRQRRRIQIHTAKSDPDTVWQGQMLVTPKAMAEGSVFMVNLAYRQPIFPGKLSTSLNHLGA